MEISASKVDRSEGSNGSDSRIHSTMADTIQTVLGRLGKLDLCHYIQSAGSRALKEIKLQEISLPSPFTGKWVKRSGEDTATGPASKLSQ